MNNRRDYLRKLIKQSAHDAAQLFGVKSVSVIAAGLVSTSIAAWAFGYFTSDPGKAWEKTVWAFLTVVVGWVVLAVVFAFYAVFKTHLTLYDQVSGQLASKEETIQSLGSQVATLTSELEKAKNANPELSMKRAKMRGFLQRLEQSKALLEASDTAAVLAFNSLDREVYNYVKEHFKAFPGYGVNPPMANSLTKQDHYSKQQIAPMIAACQNRIEFVTNILGHLE
ncbi:MAG TPA: hypothetical protein VHD36_12430 [Pirellulales bacterium]|nr:hypothetical protein [Pirellulales bacterium]